MARRATADSDVEAKLAAWRKLQKSVALTPAKADAWVRQIRAERRASSVKHEPKRR